MGEWLLREVGFASLRHNSKLRDELLNLEVFYGLGEAKVLIESWRQHFNTVRRHSSLGYVPPAPEAILPRSGNVALWPGAPALEGAPPANSDVAPTPGPDPETWSIVNEIFWAS